MNSSKLNILAHSCSNKTLVYQHILMFLPPVCVWSGVGQYQKSQFPNKSVLNQSATDVTRNFDRLTPFITHTYWIPHMICLHVGCADGCRRIKCLLLRGIYDKGAVHLICKQKDCFTPCEARGGHWWTNFANIFTGWFFCDYLPLV